MRELLRALVSAVVLLIVAWLVCELWHSLDAEGGGDFPDNVACVVTYLAAVLVWVYFNFGSALRR